MDMRLGAWTVRSLYSAGSLMTVVKEISNYKLDLVGVQEVRGTEVALNQQVTIHFSVERGMKSMN
jgi:ACT domain-containing protein